MKIFKEEFTDYTVVQLEDGSTIEYTPIGGIYLQIGDSYFRLWRTF